MRTRWKEYEEGGGREEARRIRKRSSSISMGRKMKEREESVKMKDLGSEE